MQKTGRRKITSRDICLEVIYNVLEKGEYLKGALDAALSSDCGIDARDRAFITMLAEGTVERKIELDYIINNYSSKRTDKLKPYIRNILRMAVYQIKYMDRVPDNASVDEAVKLAVKKGYGALRGYVNGVLRNIARTYEDVSYPDPEKEPVKYYSVRYSMPEWIVTHLMGEMAEDELVCSLEYFLSGPELTLRLTKRDSISASGDMLKEAGYQVSGGCIFDYALRIKQAGNVSDIPGYDDGNFAIQDESSMIPAHVIAEYVRSDADVAAVTACKPDRLKILDMCAAPGGKSLHAAALLGDMAEIDARDVSESKTDMIRKNIERLGTGNITVSEADALVRYDCDRELYDIIIADLPCSGLGVMAKKPDIKYNIKESDFHTLSRIQSDMLDNAAFYVKPGGIIVYSTCTVNSGENETNCRRFLDRHPEFGQVDIKCFVPEHIRESVTGCGSLKIIPGKYDSDGFFVAMFQRL